MILLPVSCSVVGTDMGQQCGSKKGLTHREVPGALGFALLGTYECTPLLLPRLVFHFPSISGGSQALSSWLLENGMGEKLLPLVVT